MLQKLREMTSPTRRNEEGASAVEYGLLVALIAAVIVLAVFALGTLVSDAFKDSCEEIDNSAGPVVESDANCQGG
jgi:pilus assembly protein Flp/PilA